MPNNQDPQDKSFPAEQPVQLTAEAELLEETFESSESLEDFTQALMNSLTSKLHANIDDIFKKNK